jgi:beta-galactosidase/beta-glucuronidase
MNRRAFLEAFCATLFAGKLGLAETHGIHVMNGGCSSPDGLTGPSTAACKSSTALVPIPVSVKGVREPVIDLGGSWKVASNPPDGFWRQNIDLSSWTNVDVPGEFATQGLQVVQNVEYPCRKSAKVPPDFTGQRLFLRFDGVYGYARVWVNGVYIRDHFGGFTSWDCEITGHVKPDRVMDLVVGITDRSDDISQASYYAKHSVAGILRGVRLIAVPPIHLNHYLVSATLDTEYENGAIHITAASSSQNYKTAQLELKLMDKLGKNAALDPSVIPLTAGSAVSEKTLAIRRPERWDAEHPNLYTFETSVVVDGQLVEILQRKIGFRTVERKANRVLVNGQPVKLRGACRHSIHPVYGRAVPPDLDERDAVLFREANINFVRTSHYPPAETFLDACDRHGIYVEEETAVCWSKADGGPSSDPEFMGRFLSQFQEMIERDREHPAILFWSLGNESEWGANFAVEH